MTGLQRLFSAGYRVFFLAAGLYAVVVITLWMVVLQAIPNAARMPFSMAPPLWHGHEMVFGYASVAVAGFLMTAVPSWVGAKTGDDHVRVGFFVMAASLWLAGRLAIGFSAFLPPVLVMVVDLAFVPLIAARVLTLLLKRPKPQQMIFLLLLGVFFVANLMMHLEWIGVTTHTSASGLRGGLLTLAALIMVIGGRVTPAFTRNAMLRSGRETGLPNDLRPLAAVSIAATLLLLLLVLVGADKTLSGWCGLAAGSAGLARLCLWRGLWTLGQPILWALHLGYGLNAAGLIALGLAALGFGAEVAALHLLGIGAVGGMTLAVMSRALLGHTGRPLIAPRLVVLGYGLLPLATLVRFVDAQWFGGQPGLIVAAGLLWLGAFALYLVAMATLFTAPRLQTADKNP